MRTPLALLGALAWPLLTAGCAESDDELADGGAECEGAKCDLADEGDTDGEEEEDVEGPPENFPEEIFEVCTDRRGDAFIEDRHAWSYEALRWSCKDVPGTEPEWRGQEYCEYFAMVQRPSEDEPDILGLFLGANAEHGVSSSLLQLNEDDVYALEADPEAIAGYCVFSSWNGDVELEEAEETCDPEFMTCAPTDLFGVPLSDPEIFRMKLQENTYEAAVQLVVDCLEYETGIGDFSNPDDPYHDAYMRACELNSAVNETEYRKSDNTVCASAMRMGECGCELTVDTPLGDLLSVKGQLGFELGSWEDPDSLPAGCYYEQVLPGAKQLVTCELTALEVLDNAMELKTYCADKYADEVVVHVPVPAEVVECTPDPDVSPYADTCSETPWIIEDTSEAE